MGASKKSRKGSSQMALPNLRGGRSPNVRNKISQKHMASTSPETTPKSTLKKEIKVIDKEDEATVQDTLLKKIKKEANNCAQPMSPVRRSSRAPVPSSRFKDMEMGASNRKRSLVSSMSEESDGDAEPYPKKSKKTSDNVQKNIALKEEVKTDLTKGNIEDQGTILLVVSESKSEEKIIKSEKAGEVRVSTDAEIEIKEEDESENEIVSKCQDESSSISASVDLPTEAANSPLVTPKTIEEEDSIDESTTLEANPCVSSGMVIEEVVHTFMDEKDVIVVKKPEESLKSPPTVISPPSVISPIAIKSEDVKTHSGTSEIVIKSQEVTLQEKDGQTVAIIKVPSNFGSDHTVSSVIDKPSISDISNEMSTVVTKTQARKKSRHGYILTKSPDDQSLVNLTGQESTSVVNVALDHSTMKSVLKPKTEASTAKPSLKTYGRVLKQESPMNTMVIKSPKQTSLLDTHANASNIVIQNVGSTQPYSLLPQTIKAVSQTEGKTYSLLAPPTELKQMLKGVSEKKFAVKGNKSADTLRHSEVTSQSQKVIIITPPSTSDTVVETTESVTVPSIASDSETMVNDVSTDQEKLGQVLVSEDTISPQLATTENVETGGTSVEGEVECENKTDTRTAGEISDQNNLLNDGEKVDGSDLVEADIKSPEATNIVLKISNTGTDVSNVATNDKQEEMSKDTEPVDDKNKEQGVVGGEEHRKDDSSESDGTKADMIDSSGEKLPVEEVVVTSSDIPPIIKMEGQEEEISNPSMNILSTALAEVEKTQNSGNLKPQRIKLIENGVVYEFQIFPEEGKTLQASKEDETVSVKQEASDGGDGSPVEQDVRKFSSGTQTFYTNKKGRPKSSDDADETEPPVHKLATIVQEGDQRKHYYYVSVVPGKTLVGKYRHSVDPTLPGCMVNKLGEYCCKECSYKTDKKANFYKHRRLHTGAKPHLCPVCKYQARTSSNLKRHMGIHDDIREFKCTQCSMSFRQKIHLERHVRYRHEEKRVKCPMCDYVCANEQPDLKMHIKRKHTQESGKTFSCPECKLVVGSRRDLKQHLKFHKDGPELKLFCKECSFVTDCKSRLQRHLVVHSNVKPFQCGVCDYKATQKEHVLRHLRSQHKIEVNKPKRPWKKQSKSDTSDNAQGNPKGDFTCGDKIFACNHCIMRFAKLINLYKHLHTQHSDIMPVETEGNYYCVVCEFSTSSKKNLLVHMRRHNMTDQTPPTHVYSCVLCRYVNPKRRNLFQHMRKKHNIDISSQVDIAGMKEEEVNATQEGVKVTELIQTEEGIYTQESSGNVIKAPTEANDGGVRFASCDLAAVANMIKIEDLTRTQENENENGEDHTLVIDSKATGDGSIPIIHTSNLMQHKAADAIEGLQALAGQAGFIIEEEVQGTEKQQTIVIEQQDGEVLSASGTTLPDGSIIISADQSIVEEQIAIDASSTEQISQIVESEETLEVSSGLTSLELTEEQLSSLQHGDMIQIEGQVYLVELTQDPESPDKQLLSFLPVAQT